MISRKRVIAVCTPFTSVFRSWLMSEIITFMLEPAKLQMNWASASGRISRRAAFVRRWTPAVGAIAAPSPAWPPPGSLGIIDTSRTTSRRQSRRIVLSR